MRKGSVTAASLVLAFVLVTGFAAIPSVHAARDPFVGSWKAIDIHYDNSQMTIVISGSQDSGYSIVLHDNGAPGPCGYGSDGKWNAMVIKATGTSSGNVLTGSGPAWCLQHHPEGATLWNPSWPMDFIYDPSTGTLTSPPASLYATFTRA